MADKEISLSQKKANSSLDDRFNWEYFLEVLIRKKYLILFTVVFSVLITTSYVFFTKPVYKAKVGFLPPKKTIFPDNGHDGSSYLPCVPKHLQNFLDGILRRANFPDGILREPRESLYTNFLERLLSFKFQEEVFKKGEFFVKFSTPNSKQTPQDLLLNLNTKIKIKQDVMAIDKLFSKPTYLEMVGTRPEAMAEYLDLLYKTAIEKIRSEAIDTLKNDHQRKIDLLKEQLALSKKFNVVENNFQYARACAGQPKWFLSGQKVLKEEIRAANLGMKAILLSNIKGAIKPSSNTLKALNRKVLQITDISQLEIEVVTITQPSTTLSKPIKPRKFLIVSVGVFMGLFLGIILAFIHDAVENLERRNKSAG